MTVSISRSALTLGVLLSVCAHSVLAQVPSRTELVKPIRNETFDRNGKTKKRKQGGNPRTVAGFLAFDGAMDGNRQVDPQIAVGGGYVLHGTNHGLIIYDKTGRYVSGVAQSGFNGGIDPKMFFDPHNRVFGFDLWNPWDRAKKKPVNISVSETSDPTGAWNTYPVPAPQGRDGGGIGFSDCVRLGYFFDGCFCLLTCYMRLFRLNRFGNFLFGSFFRRWLGSCDRCLAVQAGR